MHGRIQNVKMLISKKKKKMNQITFNLLDVNEMTESGGKIRFVFLLLFIRNIDFTSMELAI